MLERLGVVIYLLGCSIAVLFGATSIYILAVGTSDERFLGLLAAGVAIISWLFGKAILYVLADR